MSWEGIERLSFLRRSWSTLPLNSIWTVYVVLRFAVRCNLVGCSWWMVAGRLIPVGTCSGECVGLRTSSTVSNLSITCRLLAPQYRWPFSWSCRCCLCVVVSMTSSSLVDVVSDYLELCETSKLFTDVRTPIPKECSQYNYVCCVLSSLTSVYSQRWSHVPLLGRESGRGNTRSGRIRSLYSCVLFIFTGQMIVNFVLCFYFLDNNSNL